MADLNSTIVEVITKEKIKIFGRVYHQNGKLVTALVDEIRIWLDTDVECDTLDQVDHIRIKPERFAHAYLQGEISPEILASKVEADGYCEFVLPMGDENYPLRVYPEYLFNEIDKCESTYTKHGDIA